MDEDRLSNHEFSLAALEFLGLCGVGGVPDYEQKLAAALDRERRDAVPRSDMEKLLRRQMPVSVPPSDPGDRPGSAAPGEAGLLAHRFASRRRRIRAEAFTCLGALLALVGLALAGIAIGDRLGHSLSGGILTAFSVAEAAAAAVMCAAFVAIFMEVCNSVQEGDGEAERAVARLVSRQRD